MPREYVHNSRQMLRPNHTQDRITKFKPTHNWIQNLHHPIVRSPGKSLSQLATNLSNTVVEDHTLKVRQLPQTIPSLNDTVAHHNLIENMADNITATLLNNSWSMTEYLTPNTTNTSHDSYQSFTTNYTHVRSAEDPDLGRDPISILITISVLYMLIFVSGLIGNISTCIVISRNKSMHTATNYYLFSLAISDLLLLISGVPLEVHKLWHPYRYPFDETTCIIQGLLSETSANATVLTITAFTIERYVAICHPFLSHTTSKLSRAIRYIIAIWLLGFCLAIPQAMQFGVVLDQDYGTQCTVKRIMVDYAFEVSGFVFFVGPMTVITVLYACIGVKLRRSRLVRTDNGCGANERRSVDSARTQGNGGAVKVNGSQTKVIRMLVAVTVAFFLCWAPFHAQRMMAVYGRANSVSHATFLAVYTALTYVSGVLYYASTCVNPLLYNIMSNKFREAFKSTLAQRCGLKASDSVRHKARYSALSRCGVSLRGASSLAEQTPVAARWQQTRAETNGRAEPEKLPENTLDLHDSGYTSKHVIALGKHPHTFYRVRQLSETSSQSTVLSTISRCEGNNNCIRKKPKQRQRQMERGPGRQEGTTLHALAERLRRGTRAVFRSGGGGKTSVLTRSCQSERNSSETISNSSLQDLDEEEYSGSELARYMAQVNSGIA